MRDLSIFHQGNLSSCFAFSYGVSPYGVWTDQMYESVGDARASWWLAPRYDVQIRITATKSHERAAMIALANSAITSKPR